MILEYGITATAVLIGAVVAYGLYRTMTLKRFILFVFPVYLVAAEYAIRFMLSYAPGKEEDLALSASTSTLIAAGLSLIAPVVIPKPVPLAAAIGEIRATVVGVDDQRLITVGWIALLLLPFAWGYALWLVHKSAPDWDITLAGIVFPGPFNIAVAIYGFGIIFTEIKEVV